jgi:AmiR/NasT family two-component response regulator
MDQVTTPGEGQWLLRAVSSAADAALQTEVVELRVTNEQLKQALASHAVIDQARGMVMAPCSSDRARDLLVDVSQHCNIKLRDVAAA